MKKIKINSKYCQCIDKPKFFIQLNDNKYCGKCKKKIQSITLLEKLIHKLFK